jgi:hypothetical protein
MASSRQSVGIPIALAPASAFGVEVALGLPHRFCTTNVKACRVHEDRLHRTRHSSRHDAIAKFQEFVRRSTGGYRHALVAPLLTATLRERFTVPQVRMPPDPNARE